MKHSMRSGSMLTPTIPVTEQPFSSLLLQPEQQKHNRYLLLSPVYYRELDGKESDQSLLWLYYWGSDEAGAELFAAFSFLLQSPKRCR
ncbi:MAG: hypothetical protein U1F27_10605 [Turneriella sp.]